MQSRFRWIRSRKRTEKKENSLLVARMKKEAEKTGAVVRGLLARVSVAASVCVKEVCDRCEITMQACILLGAKAAHIHLHAVAYTLGKR